MNQSLLEMFPKDITPFRKANYVIVKVRISRPCEYCVDLRVAKSRDISEHCPKCAGRIPELEDHNTVLKVHEIR